MRWLRLLAWTIGGLVVAVVALFMLLQTPPGLRFVARLVSSSDLRISGLSGFIPTDIHADRIELRDKQGAWLTVNDARVRWSFSSLFSGRVRIEEVTAAQVEVMRPPLPSDQAAKTNSSFGLPVGVDLGTLSVGDLHVGAALGGVDSHWKLTGTGLLTGDGTPSRLKLDMNRSDGPTAHLSADIGFSLDRFAVDGQIVAEETT